MTSKSTNKNFVFLPGTLCDERLFQHQTQVFGPSHAINLRDSETFEEMVELVAKSPFEKFILIGFSMGGYVAQEAALKFANRIEKLIVVASSSKTYPQAEKDLVLSTLKSVEIGNFKGITDRRLKEYLHPTSYENESIRKIIHDMNGHDAKKVYLRQVRATIDRRDITDEMQTLKMPSLFIAGADDQIFKINTVEESAKNVPGAKFVKVENCGHFIPLEKPQELNEIISKFIYNT